MATIPNPESIQTRQIDTQQPVYRPDTSYAGEGAKVLGGVAKELYERQVNQEVAKAGVEFQVMKAQEDVAYIDDDDEDTIEDRYEAGVMEGLGKAAMGITDGEVRAAFVQNSQVSVNEGQIKMKLLAHQKRGDKQIAYLTNATDTILKGAIAGGNLSDAHTAVESMWRSLQEQGYISAVDAENQIRKSKYDMALGKLKTMQPEEQIEALKEEWITELPLDQRIELKNAANEKLRLRSAQVAARDVMDLPPGKAESALWEKLGPGELYDAAITQYFKQRGIQERDKAQMQGELYNVFHSGILSDTLTTDQIALDYPQEWFDVEPTIRNNLIAIENQRATGKTRTVSDFNTYHKLQWLYKTNRFTDAYDYFMKNSANLSPADRKLWSGLTIDGVLPVEAKALFNAQQLLDTLTKDWGPDQRMLIHVELSDWYDGVRDETGKYPPADVVNDQIRSRLIPQTTARFLGVDVGSQYVPEDMEQKIDAYVYKDTDEEKELFLNRYDKPTQKEIVAGANLRLAGEGGADMSVPTAEPAEPERMGTVGSKAELREMDPRLYDDAMEFFGVGTIPTLQQIEAKFYQLKRYEHERFGNGP